MPRRAPIQTTEFADPVTLRVVDIGVDGKAVAQADSGKTVFVDGGLPGETISARIFARSKRYDRAKLVSIVAPSVDRVAAACAHFGVCGGCAWQDLSYDAQLRLKKKQTIDALARLGGFNDVTVDNPIGSSDRFYYRNKMEFSFHRDSEDPSAVLSLGLHSRERFDSVFDVTDCRLESPRVNPILAWLREYATAQSLPAYDKRLHVGFLRFVVIREGKNTGESMVHLVTTSGEFPDARRLSEEFARAFPEVTTLTRSVTDTRANVAYGELADIFFGPGFIRERILDHTFRVYPNSFFQTNTTQTERLYTLIQNYASLAPHERVLDLYCGAGTITLTLAPQCMEIIGVESEPVAIRGAIENAADSRVANARFIAGDVRATLRERKSEFHATNVIITDPPRAGMSPRAIYHMTDLGATRIVYVSCNPGAFARDAASIRERGYALRQVTPVDMFPHTPHIELVTLFVRN